MQILLRVILFSLFFITVVTPSIQAGMSLHMHQLPTHVVYKTFKAKSLGNILDGRSPFEITEKNETFEDTNEETSNFVASFCCFHTKNIDVYDDVNYGRYRRYVSDCGPSKPISLVILFHSWKIDI